MSLGNGLAVAFGYDALDRLTSAAGGYGSLTYAWDAASNRSSRSWTQGGVTVTDTDGVAGSSNRLLSVSRGGQSRTLGHDAAGNVTADTRFDGTVFGYAYDGDGRLASVTRNGLAEASYGYDAFQRRVLKSSGGLTRHFLYDPDGYLLAEASSAGAVITEWIWLGDRPLAVVADVDTASPRILWAHSDHLGTPQQLTDLAGNLAWDAVLEPFGELADLVVGLVDQPLRLPGQYAEPLTGLHHNWHRDYDPSLARYLQPDPIGLAGGANLYGYAYADPVSWTDRDGRNPALITAIVRGAIIAIPPIALFWHEYVAPAIQGWVDGGFPDGAYCPLPDRWYNEGDETTRLGDRAYYPPPKRLTAYPDATPTKRKTPVQGGGGLRQRWKDSKGRIYEWDSKKGTVEVYDKRGKHKGEFDPETGGQIEGPNPRREVEP
jgi:RHS repeat-associated protein